MKLQPTGRAIALTSALCALLGAVPATMPAAVASPAHNVGNGTHKQGKTPGAKPAPARAAQSVRIVIDGDYQPATVRVRAGVPTTLTFVLKSDSGCGNTVEIPALKKTLALRVGQSRSVHFTPAKNQVIGFACPMKMIKGSVTAR